MRWLCCVALLALAGCGTGSLKIKAHEVPDYLEAARLMPADEAQETLEEVLAQARGDDPNRNNNPLENVVVEDTYFEALVVYYNAAGNNMGRTPLKLTYKQLTPHAYEVKQKDKAVVYFVKLDGPYASAAFGGWSVYPSAEHRCLWFAHPDDVKALFETITCLKTHASSD